MKRFVAGLIIGVVMAAGGVAIAGTGNDTVYHEKQYKEFFKQEGNGEKNYLYTRTEQPAPPLGKCYVYTFASERAGAVFCNVGARTG